MLAGAGRNNAVLAGIIHKTPPTWSYKQVQAYGPGKVFTECDEMVIKSLENVGFDPIILMETANWRPNTGKKFNIKKEQVVNIPASLQ